MHTSNAQQGHGTSEAARYKQVGIVRLSPEGHDRLLAIRQHYGMGLSAVVEELVRNVFDQLGAPALV